MNQPAPPNPAQVMPILWGSLMSAQAIVVGLGFFLAHGQGVTPTFELARLLPAEGPGGILMGVAFATAVAAVVVPARLAGMVSSSSPSGSDAQRAMTPFILHMAMAEAATLCGFVGAVFVTTPPVPERIILPALCGLVAGLLGFPSASRIKVLAGVRS